MCKTARRAFKAVYLASKFLALILLLLFKELKRMERIWQCNVFYSVSLRKDKIRMWGSEVTYLSICGLHATQEAWTYHSALCKP